MSYAEANIVVEPELENNVEQLSFTVDAGIINRLGLELFQRPERAVAELIKNAYDADASEVTITYDNTREEGGTIIIEDDGTGMNRDQLINGFLRIASTEKLHQPTSELYGRPRAGKKGIGRFAARFLGDNLTVITQHHESEKSYELTLDWTDYEVDTDISKIKNSLEEIKENTKYQGTKLIIKNARHAWSQADIKRTYRYIAELIQPTFLEVKEGTKQVSNKTVEVNAKNKFEPKFIEIIDGKKHIVADKETMMFDRALAVISGYINKEGYGYCTVKSEKFGLSDEDVIPIFNIKKDKKKHTPFDTLIGTKVLFKSYYFITDSGRINYYRSGFTTPELNVVKEYLDEKGGTKLYRNSFRVPNYGESNDWLGINKKKRVGQGVPFSNKNIAGFVQIEDHEGIVFEEVAGREGLIETDAFEDMKAFISSALVTGFKVFVSALKNSKEYKSYNKQPPQNTNPTDVKSTANEVVTAAAKATDENATPKEKAQAASDVAVGAEKLNKQVNALTSELEMLRILAGVGLNIGEFVHEIKHFSPSFQGSINNLIARQLGDDINTTLLNMRDSVESFKTYTAYFDSAISQNIVRELKPVDMRDVVRDFQKVVQHDLKRKGIILQVNPISGGYITTPMHTSEWNTILRNLYSNAKKAIDRTGRQDGQVLIDCRKDDKFVFLSFMDNGDGIPKKNQKKIFNAWFTTSTSTTSNGQIQDEVQGTGLGLHIMKNIITNRKGEMYVDTPIEGYQTSISIKLPLNKPS